MVTETVVATMKFRNKSAPKEEWKRRVNLLSLWNIALYASIALSIVILTIVFFSPQKPPTDLPASSPVAQTPEATEESEEEIATIQLPGAESIPKMSGSYTNDDHLWRLVNKSHPLSDLSYRPELAKPNVRTRADKSLDEQSVRKDIAPAVEALFMAAKEAGYELEIGSGFRSAELQNTYYTNYVRVYGQAAADAVSAKPGYSEHQTGLAIDISTTDRACYLEDCFGDLPAGIWLKEHAHEHGFILRYPKEKEGITDFRYEPWHFRYVGKELTGALVASGLSMDEAWEYMTK